MYSYQKARKLFLLSFCFSVCISPLGLHAQAFGSYFDVRDFQKGVKIGGGVVFGSYLHSNVIAKHPFFETGQGYQLEIHTHLPPLVLEINLFTAAFAENVIISRSSAKDGIRNYGGDISASINLLPVSYYAYPYAGIGYQWHRLHPPGEKSPPGHDIIPSDPSGPIWRVGWWFNFSHRLGIRFDYRQSFPKRVAFSQNGVLIKAISFEDRPETYRMLSASLIFSFNTYR